jgi:hypothetical protein
LMFTLDELYAKAPTEEARKNLIGHFGSLVVGGERAKEEAELLARMETDPSLTFGPLVTGTTDAPVLMTPDAIHIKTFADLKAAVEQKPEAREALMWQELERKPRPWKAAMLLFRELELHRTGGPRGDVMNRIGMALGREPTTE